MARPQPGGAEYEVSQLANNTLIYVSTNGGEANTPRTCSMLSPKDFYEREDHNLSPFLMNISQIKNSTFFVLSQAAWFSVLSGSGVPGCGQNFFFFFCILSSIS